jgi:hypothetical protein
VTPDFREEDTGEITLRPSHLDDFIGQRPVRENLRVFVEAARGAATRWTTSSSPARRGSARRPWRRSWRANSASAFA